MRPPPPLAPPLQGGERPAGRARGCRCGHCPPCKGGGRPAGRARGWRCGHCPLCKGEGEQGRARGCGQGSTRPAFARRGTVRVKLPRLQCGHHHPWPGAMKWAASRAWRVVTIVTILIRGHSLTSDPSRQPSRAGRGSRQVNGLAQFRSATALSEANVYTARREPRTPGIAKTRLVPRQTSKVGFAIADRRA